MQPSNRTELLRERTIFVIEKRTENSEMSAGCWYKIPSNNPLSQFIPLSLSSQFQTGFCCNADYCPRWDSCTRVRFHCQILQLTTTIQFQYSHQQMLQFVIPGSARPENKVANQSGAPLSKTWRLYPLKSPVDAACEFYGPSSTFDKYKQNRWTERWLTARTLRDY